MWCSACGSQCQKTGLCDRCRISLRSAPDQVAGDVYVRSAYVHEGAARLLVHALKYGGSRRAAEVLADAVAELVDPTSSAMVPVPRVFFRRWRYGVDPALALARAINARTGIPVVRALSAPAMARVNAGAPRRRRSPPQFLLTKAVDDRAVLVDDVVTTGRTIHAASLATNGVVQRAVSATTARGVTSLTINSQPGGT